jgi:hypothetical protein
MDKAIQTYGAQGTRDVQTQTGVNRIIIWQTRERGRIILPKIKLKTNQATQTRKSNSKSKGVQTTKVNSGKRKLSRKARKRLEVKIFGTEISSSEDEKESSPKERNGKLTNGGTTKQDKEILKEKEGSLVNKVKDERAQERERAKRERKAKRENLDAFRNWEPSHEWPIKF